MTWVKNNLLFIMGIRIWLQVQKYLEVIIWLLLPMLTLL